MYHIKIYAHRLCDLLTNILGACMTLAVKTLAVPVLFSNNSSTRISLAQVVASLAFSSDIRRESVYSFSSSCFDFCKVLQFLLERIA